MNRKCPLSSEYRASIQNNRHVLQDSELQAGTVLTTRLGLPLSWSGSFAIVFKIKTVRGVYAVRCFTGRLSDQYERYQALSNHLRKHRPNSFVDFQFIQKGILVNNEWWPIIKMPWVEGVHLDQYVENLVKKKDTNSLAKLTAKFGKLLLDLEYCQIAHGDLQHGNIIVGDQLRLIDYDGIYVPAFNGRSSLEIGHRNYQHPGRKNQDFGKGLDGFSGLVIYLSLLALSRDPSLWRFHKDDMLLLGNKDYQNKVDSEVFQTLIMKSSEEVAKFTLILLTNCSNNYRLLTFSDILKVHEQMEGDLTKIRGNAPSPSNAYDGSHSHIKTVRRKQKAFNFREGYCSEPSCGNKLGSSYKYNAHIDKLFNQRVPFCSSSCHSLFWDNEICQNCQKIIPDQYYIDDTIFRSDANRSRRFCSLDCLIDFRIKHLCSMCGKRLGEKIVFNKHLNKEFDSQLNFCTNACCELFKDKHLCAQCQQKIPADPKTSKEINKNFGKEMHFCCSSCLNKFSRKKMCHYCGMPLGSQCYKNDVINEAFGEPIWFCSEKCLRAHFKLARLN
jgi:hypothetical protein